MKTFKLIIGLCVMIALLSFTIGNENEMSNINEVNVKNDIFSLSNDGYTVDEFYKKIELDYGTLDENGHQIDFIFVKTKIDAGDYEIELTDGPGDLYEIIDTDLYITFNGYFGYAGYGTECILRVEYYYSTVYKIE